MEYSRIQKLIYWLKCKKHFQDIQKSFNYTEEQLGSIMILLPDTAIAFDFAELILDEISPETADKTVFLLKDSLAQFYSDKLQKCSKLYSYKDVDSLGLPNEWFIDIIKKDNYQNMIDLNITFSPFSSFLVRACNSEVRMGFNYDNSKKYYNVILDRSYQKDLSGTFDMIGKFIKK
ncbi:MAG: hypothetical protein VYA20_01195 [Candidatus Neomarinimicrobiota bacterium]|nr:hypothetical protein [Candidatus Neomarinimicrobiota bacterium]